VALEQLDEQAAVLLAMLVADALGLVRVAALDGVGQRAMIACDFARPVREDRRGDHAPWALCAVPAG